MRTLFFILSMVTAFLGVTNGLMVKQIRKSNAVARDSQTLATNAIAALNREVLFRTGPCWHLGLPEWNIINATNQETANIVVLTRCQPSGEISHWKATRFEPMEIKE